MESGYIYIFTSPSGKKYIGQTIQMPEDRWKYGHRYLEKYKNGKYKQPKLARAITKYGFNSFKKEIFEYPIDELDTMEKFLIEKYDSIKNGYNTNIGGRKLSAEDQSRISKKYWADENYKNHLIECIKASWTSEKRKKASDKSKEQWKDTDLRSIVILKKSIPVVQLDLSYNYIQEFKSAKDAAEALKISTYGDITRVCKHTRKTAASYIWLYKSEYESGNFMKINPRENKGSSKEVIQILNGHIINTFSSVTEASNFIGLKSRRSIINCCNGKQKLVKGFSWKYKKDYYENKNDQR